MTKERCYCGATDCATCGPMQGYPRQKRAADDQRFYLCPQCGHEEWTMLRKHTLWETLRVDHVTPQGSYNENDNDFGETDTLGDIEDIVCSHCDSVAPPDHPLWPTKEDLLTTAE